VTKKRDVTSPVCLEEKKNDGRGDRAPLVSTRKGQKDAYLVVQKLTQYATKRFKGDFKREQGRDNSPVRRKGGRAVGNVALGLHPGREVRKNEPFGTCERIRKEGKGCARERTATGGIRDGGKGLTRTGAGGEENQKGLVLLQGREEKLYHVRLRNKAGLTYTPRKTKRIHPKPKKNETERGKERATK